MLAATCYEVGLHTQLPHASLHSSAVSGTEQLQVHTTVDSVVGHAMLHCYVSAGVSTASVLR